MDSVPTLEKPGPPSHASGMHRRPRRGGGAPARAAVVVAAGLVTVGAVLGLRSAVPGGVGAATTSGPGHALRDEPALVTEASTEASTGASTGAATGAVTDAPARVPLAVAVLRRWDTARARAFEQGDPVRLRALYLPRSRAGGADVRLLRSYLRRGLRVTGMRTQVLSVNVLLERPGRVRLRVVDRLAGAEVVDLATGRRVPLPRDAASERVVELRRSSAGTWRVGSVSG